MARCPLDCAVPEVCHCRFRWFDYFWLPFLMTPYVCNTCGTRFHRIPSAVLQGLLGILVLGLAYPLSYPFVERYVGHQNHIVQWVYGPMDSLADRAQSIMGAVDLPMPIKNQ